VDTSIPEGFGEAQKDAKSFTKIAIKSKKRKLEDITQSTTNATNGVVVEEKQIDPNAKRSSN